MKCTWLLSTCQPASNPPFSSMQEKLTALGVMLDYSFVNGAIKITLECPDYCHDNAQIISNTQNPANAAESSSDTNRKLGRPFCEPQNDLTLGRVRHMRFMRVPVAEIAATIGVSKRTFYRKWAALNSKNVDDNTPFSKW